MHPLLKKERKKERKKENNTALGADRSNPLTDSMEQKKTRLSLLHILHVYTREQEGAGGVCGGGGGGEMDMFYLSHHLGSRELGSRPETWKDSMQ